MGPRLLRASDRRRHVRRPRPLTVYVCRMDFAFTDRCNEYRETLLAFMDEYVYPNESVYHEQLVAQRRSAPSPRGDGGDESGSP